MNGITRLLFVLSLSLMMVNCATSTDGASSDDSPAVEEDFNDFDNIEASADSGADPNSEASLENELNQAEGAPAVEPEQQVADSSESTDEFAEFESQSESEQQQQQDQQVAQNSLAPVEDPPPQVDTWIEPPPPEVAAPAVVEESFSSPESPAQQTPALARIKNIRYKANDNGGTLIIDADGPLTFQTRLNPDTNQFVVEIPNSELPVRLKRPFNTKDMSGGIGAVDAYQSGGSTTSRIVIQLRGGIPEPTVQAEGNSLLVVQSGGGSQSSEAGAIAAVPDKALVESAENLTQTAEAGPSSRSAILSTSSLEEFMVGNTQFYGKKISLEVSQMDVREVFKLIGEESGINLVLSDEVKGTITLKLRQVPWDQALVVIMKSRKLGYTRAGNVLRIAPLADIKSEEDDALKAIAARKAQVPLKVRVIPVSYAKIDDLSTHIKPFLSERGKVIGDNRTSSIVVSDLEENLDRIAKLVASVDVPPAQVLIEGKIVEASEQFQKQVGVNWSASGQQGLLGYGSGRRPIRGFTNVTVSPSLGSAAAQLNFQLGRLDVLGDLNATLALYEQQNSVKVLSSPRIVTLHNESAEINQSTEIPLVQETITNGVTSRNVNFKPVRLKLNVTPQITNDASILMTVDVNREFLLGTVDARTQASPIATRAAKTKVMVRNAQTAVIGGIYQSDQSVGESRVPWVSEIPILGWLFKSRTNQDGKNELLIFLTPRILGQNDSTSSSQIGGKIE
jgi:type IV pilus assembly protein PilQ